MRPSSSSPVARRELQWGTGTINWCTLPRVTQPARARAHARTRTGTNKQTNKNTHTRTETQNIYLNITSRN